MKHSIELVKSWQAQDNPQIDLLAIAECSDVNKVVPMELDGQFWVIVQSTISFAAFNHQAEATVFDIKSDYGNAKIQIQPIEAWANQESW